MSAYIILRAVLAAAVIAIIASSASAQSGNPSVGRGLICDTGEQASQFVAARNSGTESGVALAAVNAAAGKATACGVALVAFIPNDVVATTRMGSKIVQIVEVQIIGYFDGKEWVRTAPITQFVVIEMGGDDI